MKGANSLRGLWIGLGFVAACLILVPFVGSLLTIGERLSDIHKWLDVAFYVVVVLAVYLLAVRPVALVLFAPTISLAELASLPYGRKMKVARRLASNSALSEEASRPLRMALARKGRLDDALVDIVVQLDESAIQKIDSKASLAFVSNTIVQNGRLEAVALLSINIRLVQTLVDHYGFRPSLASLLRIYGEVFVTAFLVDEIGELDIDSAISTCVSPAIAAVPGLHVITHSLVQGATSALFTLRVGMITRDILKEGIGPQAAKHERRKQANREAAARAAVVFPQAMSELKDALINRFNPLG